jgi:hypothetical protein
MSTSTPATRSCRRAATFALAAVATALSARLGAAPATSRPPAQRGVALGLYSEDPTWSYVDMLDEMVAVGTTHVAIVVPYYMKDYRSHEIYRHPRFSAPMSTIERTVGDARARGLEVFLFPILRLEDESNGNWRGNLKPDDVDAFYASYEAYIVAFAEFAERLRIPLLSVGSELASMDVDTPRWRKVIASVRAVYRGAITYSANWDHYDAVGFFDALDYAGVTGYFELAEKARATEEDPGIEQLVHSWREVYQRLMRWQHRVGKPILMTEVGYLSQRGAAARPWNEGANEALDLDLQRRCYEAFRRVWDGEDRLAGAYFWNWFGWGGPTSKEYTPRAKPAAKEVAAWYGAGRRAAGGKGDAGP